MLQPTYGTTLVSLSGLIFLSKQQMTICMVPQRLETLMAERINTPPAYLIAGSGGKILAMKEYRLQQVDDKSPTCNYSKPVIDLPLDCKEGTLQGSHSHVWQIEPSAFDLNLSSP